MHVLSALSSTAYGRGFLLASVLVASVSLTTGCDSGGTPSRLATVPLSAPLADQTVFTQTDLGASRDGFVAAAPADRSNAVLAPDAGGSAISGLWNPPIDTVFSADQAPPLHQAYLIDGAFSVSVPAGPDSPTQVKPESPAVEAPSTVPEPSSESAFAFTGLFAAGLMLKARRRKAAV